jgi:hypothetical protein
MLPSSQRFRPTAAGGLSWRHAATGAYRYEIIEAVRHILAEAKFRQGVPPRKE